MTENTEESPGIWLYLRSFLLPLAIGFVAMLLITTVQVLYFRTADINMAANQLTSRSDVYIEAHQASHYVFTFLYVATVVTTGWWMLSRFINIRFGNKI